MIHVSTSILLDVFSSSLRRPYRELILVMEITKREKYFIGSFDSGRAYIVVSSATRDWMDIGCKHFCCDT
jgi:hypothetical protein